MLKEFIIFIQFIFVLNKKIVSNPPVKAGIAAKQKAARRQIRPKTDSGGFA